MKEQQPKPFENLTKEGKKKKIADLKLFETQFLDGVKDPNNAVLRNIFKTRKDVITAYAESLRDRHYLGEYKEPINTISNYIKAQIRKLYLVNQYETINLIHYVHVTLKPEFKSPELSHTDGVTKLPQNTSAFEKDHQFHMDGIKAFIHYHKRFADIGEDHLKKISDPQVFKDFQKVIEWNEIGLFSHYLGELASENGILDQIEDLQDFKQSATIIQLAMAKIMHADGDYAQMAWKLGVSTKENRNIRKRLAHWPKKDAKKAIMKIAGSYLCPGGCGHNFITGKKYQDITSEKYFPKWQWSEKRITIPKSLKNKGLTVFQIGEKVFGKKIKLIVKTFEQIEAEKQKAKLDSKK